MKKFLIFLFLSISGTIFAQNPWDNTQFFYHIEDTVRVKPYYTLDVTGAIGSGSTDTNTYVKKYGAFTKENDLTVTGKFATDTIVGNNPSGTTDRIVLINTDGLLYNNKILLFNDVGGIDISSEDQLVISATDSISLTSSNQINLTGTTIGLNGVTTITKDLIVSGRVRADSVLNLLGALILNDTVNVTGRLNATQDIVGTADIYTLGGRFIGSASNANGTLGVLLNATADGVARLRNFGLSADASLQTGSLISGHKLFTADNTFDVGASGTEARNIYFDGDIIESGTTKYLTSAWGSQTGTGSLVLSNLAVATLTINGITYNVVVNP